MRDPVNELRLAIRDALPEWYVRLADRYWPQAVIALWCWFWIVFGLTVAQHHGVIQ